MNTNSGSEGEYDGGIDKVVVLEKVMPAFESGARFTL
jgi:hypothetical protein